MKYICDPQIVPTVVPKDSASLVAYAHAVASYCTWLHVDINDGDFAAPRTWPLDEEVGNLRELLPETLSLEAHLMVRSPEALAERLVLAGFSRIVLHLESFADCDDARRALTALKTAGAKEVGLAILLETPLPRLFECIDECDFVQVMSVEHIGEQGQPFAEQALTRVEEIHAEYPDMMVAVDGGVSEATVEELVRAGANRLLVGHALAQSSNAARLYGDILERAMKGCQPIALSV